MRKLRLAVLIASLFAISAFAVSGCVDDAPIETHYTEDYGGRYRFAVDGDRVFFVSYSLSGANATNLAGYVPLTQPEFARYTRSDTFVVSNNRLLRFPGIFEFNGDSTRLLGWVDRNPETMRMSIGYGGAFAMTENLVLVARRTGNTNDPYRSSFDTVNRLEIYNIAGTIDSVVVGSIELHQPQGIATHGSYAYVDEEDRIAIIDLSVPSQPRKVGTINVADVTHMTVANNTLVLTQNKSVIQYDVSDPTSPVRLGSVN